MEKKQIIRNWIIKAGKDIQTAMDLFKTKHYDWSLFVWHLAIEKTFKAKIVSSGKEIIYTHDLVRLAKLAEFPLNTELINQLNEITTFNIEVRYDDYKLSFYKKADLNYAEKWSRICKKIYNLAKKAYE